MKGRSVTSTPRLLLAVVCIAYGLVSWAEPIITVPGGLNPGDEYRLVFITKDQTTATASDISFYNDFVSTQAQLAAELVALGTTWKAIGSTASVSAKMNTETDDSPTGLNGVPIYRLDGAIIADNYDDLWDGSIQSPLYVAQDGSVLDTCCGTWTGTLTTGEIATGNALGDGPLVVDGAPNGSGTNWIQTNPYDSSQPQYLYAISSILTVPIEPRTVGIDVNPGAERECRNSKPVVIFGESDFDVVEIDVSSLQYGNEGSITYTQLCAVDYVNDDPYADLVCRFVPGQGEAVLRGGTSGGTPFIGSDTICVAK